MEIWWLIPKLNLQEYWGGYVLGEDEPPPTLDALYHDRLHINE